MHDACMPLNSQGRKLKKVTAALLLLPLFAHAKANYPNDPETARACYKNLTATSSRDEVLGTIACLKNNPFAGEETLKEFRQAQGAVLARFQQAPGDSGMTAALADLDARKAHRVYLSYRSRNQERVFIVDKALLGDRPLAAADIEALDVQFIHTSAIFSKDKRVPLRDVKAFSYQEAARTQGIGDFKTRFADNSLVTDGSYQGRYPMKVYDVADESQWIAITALAGTSYQVSPSRKNQNDRIAVDQNSLSGVEITFLSEDEAKQRIAKVEQLIQADQDARTQANQAAQEKAKLQMQKKAQTLAEMAKVQRGAEDACKRTDLGGYVVKYDPEAVEINCQFGGIVELQDLKSAGWLVVNKSKDKDGVVTDYYIRKAR